MSVEPLLSPGALGPLTARNRLVRAGTSETMASPGGAVTPALIELYRRLAANEVGTIITGHLYCHPRGQYAARQTGIHHDGLVEGLAGLVDAVHAEGALILAQVAHAGSQSRLPGNRPVAPSPVPNALTGRAVEQCTEGEIEEAIGAFADGARRAVEAGFDGVHIHGANGYLISEFTSPVTNQRHDAWGAGPEGRSRFGRAVVRAVSAAVPSGRALTMKVGLVDATPGGLDLDTSVRHVKGLVGEGLDGVEVSCNVMVSPTDSARRYVAVDRTRAANDLLVHRLLSPPAEEAYFVPWARRLRRDVDTTVIAVGGMRRPATMAGVLRAGDADFVAMARPFIRQPDVARRIAEGSLEVADCTSCNICLMHEGRHSLRCWRVPRRRLAQHAAFRLLGGLRG